MDRDLNPGSLQISKTLPQDQGPMLSNNLRLFKYIEVIFVFGFIRKFVDFLHRTTECCNYMKISVFDNIGPRGQVKDIV
jgi:hypothetical protein